MSKDNKPVRQNISEEERRRRSERAKANPNFGGAGKGQGRKKKETANQKVAREAARHGAKIMETLLDVLDNGTKRERLNAAQMILDIEAKEKERQSKETNAQIENASKQELIDWIKEQKQAQIEQKATKAADIIIPEDQVEELD